MKGFTLEDNRKMKLRERAEFLAGKAEVAVGESNHETMVIEFSLSGERYAFESEHVREVLPLGTMIQLPCTPPHVLGIINVRGQILTVIDLRIFFELPLEAKSGALKVIVLESEHMEFGIVADSIEGQRMIPIGGLHSALSTMTGIREVYLRGLSDEGLVVLDAAKLLSDRSLVVDDEVDA